MIRQRIRIMRFVAVALTAGAGVAPAAMAMPQHGASGLVHRPPATEAGSVARVIPATPMARVPLDQSAPSSHAPATEAGSVARVIPATPMARVPLDQSAPSSHATPGAAMPTGKEPGSSFDWTALGIGIGVLGALVLIGVLRSVTRRSRDPRRERAAATS